MIYQGDCLDILPTLEANTIQCCVTSPPYYGLRDYGCAGQIGLEGTPDEYVEKLVAVFREVRRVLADDGTLWLNLGDSYSGSMKGSGGNDPERSCKQVTNSGSYFGSQVDNARKINTGLKPKDLMGIPWRVAFALQQPYYSGKIKNELDRVWAAAMLDAEGNISVSQYENNGRVKSNIYITITNSSTAIIDKCDSLFPQEMKHIYEKSDPLNVPVFRWDVERMENKSLFIQEIYPYLVAKRKQAILGYTFLDMQMALLSKKKGYLQEQQEKRTWVATAMSKLNHGEQVDLPDWVIEPPSLYEQGYYLRQDIIWSKPNPMPESVTDRCTKSHEYIFLLSKSARYYYDNEAVQELSVSEPGTAGSWNGNRDFGLPNGQTRFAKPNLGGSIDGKRNKRSVWNVATQPYKEAHFATFPQEIPRTCILAGSKEGDTILDPFCGSGTTGQEALKLDRNFIGIELNQKYVNDLIIPRLDNVDPLFRAIGD